MNASVRPLIALIIVMLAASAFAQTPSAKTSRYAGQHAHQIVDTYFGMASQETCGPRVGTSPHGPGVGPWVAWID